MAFKEKESEKNWRTGFALVIGGGIVIFWVIGGSIYLLLNAIGGHGDAFLSAIATPFSYFAAKMGIQRFWVALAFFSFPVLTAFFVFCQGRTLLLKGLLVFMILIYALMWGVVIIS
ncbi:MAG: hypothetical protein WCV41_00700 [Patescibacteria group bacterium]